MKPNKLFLAALAVSVLTLSAGAYAEGPEGGPHKGKGAHFFEKVDTNADGKISVEEHMAAAEERFKKMDSDGDGFVTKEEAHEKMKKMHGKFKKHKKEMGSEGESSNNGVE